MSAEQAGESVRAFASSGLLLFALGGLVGYALRSCLGAEREQRQYAQGYERAKEQWSTHGSRYWTGFWDGVQRQREIEARELIEAARRGDPA